MFTPPWRREDKRNKMSFIILFIVVTYIILFLPKLLGGRKENNDAHEFNAQRLSRKDKDLILKYGDLSAREIILNEEIDYFHKILLLQQVHDFTYEEAREFCNTTIIEEKKNKLKA